ncbi:hypothetical protein NOM01_11180 [Sporolactobacillus sp. STSJ-5]|nr:hypothetical protein [Sporolactobacillus sp. STSJ-5]MCQ2010579.1 hypothetical protein [Sporolactobacillus sp. STSJ-5]
MIAHVLRTRDDIIDDLKYRMDPTQFKAYLNSLENLRKENEVGNPWKK